MYQQQLNSTAMQTPLPDEAWALTVLSDLKRVVNEYAIAATESSCPEVKKLFTSLLNSTLQVQGELYTAMQQANLYKAPSPALRQDIQKEIATYQQQQQQTQQFVHQRLNSQQQQQQAQQQFHQPVQQYVQAHQPSFYS